MPQGVNDGNLCFRRAVSRSGAASRKATPPRTPG